METNLHNRVVFVTGGSLGLGKVIALTLAGEGAHIIINGRDELRLAQAKAEIEQKGVRAYITHGDVTKPKEVEAFFEMIVKQTGRLDILINNVGGVETFGDFFTLKDHDWNRAFSLNFMSMVYCTRCAVPWLRKSDAPRIINIATVPARQPGLFNPHYSAAKAAMVNCSKHLADVLAKDGILVNAICPGSLTGESFDRNVADRAARDDVSIREARRRMQEEEHKKVPLQRMGTPEDVASLVAYLVSSRNQFITGTCISVDGGATRSMM